MHEVARPSVTGGAPAPVVSHDSLLYSAAIDPHRNHAAVRVLAWCHGRLERHRYRPLKTSAAALVLGMKRQTVGEALRLLVVRGYLEPAPRDGAVHTFRILTSQRAATAASA